MEAIKSKNSKTLATTKKTAKATKSKSKSNNIVSPKLRKQMIAEAAYFKALNRDFQGDYCVEDWLEAETEIDTLIKGT